MSFNKKNKNWLIILVLIVISTFWFVWVKDSRKKEAKCQESGGEMIDSVCYFMK